MHIGNDRYEVIKKIGEGASGYVYLARDRKFQRNVALKRLTTDASVGEDIVTHIEAWARVPGHTNLVPIYSYEKIVFVKGRQPLPAIAMELVPGETLRQKLRNIKEGKSLTPTLDEFILLYDGILNGLEHLHAHGVPHCDLHSGNILIGQGGVPRIIDPYPMYPTSKTIRPTKSEIEDACKEDIGAARAIIGEAMPRDRLPESMRRSVLNSIAHAQTIEEIRAELNGLFRETPTAKKERQPEGLPDPNVENKELVSETSRSLRNYALHFREHKWDEFFFNLYIRRDSCLDLSCRKDFPPQYLRAVADFAPLAEQFSVIDLYGTRITDTAAEAIALFKNVAKLRLGSTGAGRRVLLACITLPKLQTLSLDECDLRFLESLDVPLNSGSLDVLSLARSNVTTDSLRALGGLKKLWALDISRCDGIQNVRALEPLLPQNGGNLRELSVRKCAVTLDARGVEGDSLLFGDEVVRAVLG